MFLSVYAVGLLITISSLTTAKFSGQKHHKVRHKHNLIGLHEYHVNEIREAFDEYRNTLSTKNLKAYPNIKDVELSDSYEDNLDNSLKRSSWETPKASQHTQRLDKASNSYQPEKKHVIPNPTLQSEYFLRNKRVFTSKASTTTATTTTVRSIDNYDEEYEDEDNDTANRRLNDDAHAGTLRFNRNISDSHKPNPESESLTDFKMKTLGTIEDVRKSFQKELKSSGQDVNHHIRQNIMRTKIDGMCRWPNKKVIEMPQHATKLYTPRKYVIYQCSDDTACCGSSDKICVAKKTEDLLLWFHVRLVDSTDVESLKVRNHTECECIYKNRVTTLRTTRLPYHWPMTISSTTPKPACRCPIHFDAEIEDGTCGCVCRDEKVECRQRYEGKEGFTMSDQRCIQDSYCVQPHCLHGTYTVDNGRCPDKQDKINKGFQGLRTAVQP